jgi:Restriction endonuclease
MIQSLDQNNTQVTSATRRDRDSSNRGGPAQSDLSDQIPIGLTTRANGWQRQGQRVTLITSITPDTWTELENTVADILRECGMDVQRQARVKLPRGSVDLDVLAQETLEGILQRVVCECKNWRKNVPREKVHAFRTVMQETGVNRGYIISRTGFQAGAIEAAEATNVELLTFEEFQERYTPIPKRYEN